MTVIERLQQQVDIRGTASPFGALAADALAEIEAMRSLARDAYDAWDHDRDARVGKLLLAMMDQKFRKTYRPDTVPNGNA